MLRLSCRSHSHWCNKSNKNLSKWFKGSKYIATRSSKVCHTGRARVELHGWKSSAMPFALCFWQITLLPQGWDLASHWESAPELLQTFSSVHQFRWDLPTKSQLSCLTHFLPWTIESPPTFCSLGLGWRWKEVVIFFSSFSSSMDERCSGWFCKALRLGREPVQRA